MTKNVLTSIIWLCVCLSMLAAWAGCKKSTGDEVFSSANFRNIMPVKERAELAESWLRWKKSNFIPEIMREEGVNMWVVTEADRNVFRFLVPADTDGLVRFYPYFLVFFAGEGADTVEELAVGNTDDIEEWGPLFPGHLFSFEESLDRLRTIIEERDPARIAIGRGKTPELEATLGEFSSRFVSADNLMNRWIEYRTPQEVDAYKIIVDITQDILAEAFSNKVITPDTTTTSDVDWWVKQKVHSLGLGGDVFGPTVMVWRSMGENERYGDPEERFNINIPPYCGTNTTIRRGDVLSCDFGIQYLGLETDIQQVGYVLKEGETEVPNGLKEALRRGNRLQDILAAEFKHGRTGNEILFAALEKAKAEDLRPEIYCHPMGTFVYRYGLKGGVLSKRGADYGPSIGSEGYFDEQGNQLPTRSGERILNTNTAYAMELDITYSVPEWGGQDIRIVLEEKVVFTKDGLIFPGGRQEKFHVIR